MYKLTLEIKKRLKIDLRALKIKINNGGLKMNKNLILNLKKEYFEEIKLGIKINIIWRIL